MLEEADELIFNEGIGSTIKETLQINKNYTINQESEFKIVFGGDFSEDVVPFSITIDNTIVPIAIRQESEAPKPIVGIEVWKRKRESSSNFNYEYEEDILKLKFRNNERTVRSEFRKNLLLEKQIIESDSFFWTEISDNELKGNEFNQEKLKKAVEEIGKRIILFNEI